jgi:hypothetical protein
MTEERWEKLKAVTWFRAEQDEVTKYVEELRARRLPELPHCTCGAKQPDTADRDDLAPERFGPPPKRYRDCPACGESVMCLAIDKVYLTSPQRWCCLNCGCAFTGPEIEAQP